MSDNIVTINEKEYDFDCLNEDVQEHVIMITEVKKELFSLSRRIKVLRASHAQLTRELGENLGNETVKKKQIFPLYIYVEFYFLFTTISSII